MEITAYAQIANPLYTYGLQRVPNMQRYDEMDAVFWSSAFTSQGLILEPNCRVLMLQPTPLQFDTPPSEWQFNAPLDGNADTSGKWQAVRDAGSGLNVLEMYDATWGRAFSCSSLFSTGPGDSFYLNLYRSDPATAPAGTTLSPNNCYTQVFVADGVLGGVRVTIAYGQAPTLDVLSAFDKGGFPIYTELARSADISDGGAYLASLSDRVLRLRFLSLPSEGAFVVGIGEGDASLVYRLNGLVVPAGPLTVTGMNGRARVQFLPMRFAAIGSIISNVRDNGIAIVNQPVPQIDYAAPAGTTAVVEGEVQLGTAYRYALTLDATPTVDSSGLATASPIVRSVSIYFPGQSYNDTVIAEADLNVRRIREELVFNIQTLTYETTHYVTCNNHDGRWTGASGYRAFSLAAGIDGDNWQRVTGLAVGVEQSRSDPRRETTFLVLGREHWLKRKKCGFLPPFDGWDVYAVIEFLCEKAGITDNWLVNLPTVPYGRGADTPYYHLPEGTGALGAKFQFDPRTPIWEAMQQVARLVRGYLGFDVYGYLRFYPWSPDYLGAYMQAFDVVPDFYNGVPLLNQLKGTFTSRVDLSDVRSDITLGSIDPYSFLPVFAHSHNESVVTNLSDPAFLGNQDEEIEINSLLFDPGLQNLTGTALESQASLPALSVSLEGYFQRQLLPLDVISVADGFCLGGLYPFYIESMQSELGVDEQAMFGATTLSGRWLLNG